MAAADDDDDDKDVEAGVEAGVDNNGGGGDDNNVDLGVDDWVPEDGPPAERRPGRAFVHLVGWEEYRPHLPGLAAMLAAAAAYDLADEEMEWFRDLEVDISGTSLELSYEQAFTSKKCNAVHAAMLLRILVDRRAELQRGDIVRMRFLRFRRRNTFFYDGQHLVPPFDFAAPNDAADEVPADFKVPTEFAADFWEDARLGEVARCQIDLDCLPEMHDIQLRPIANGKNGPQEVTARHASLSILGRPWHLFIILNPPTDDTDDDDDDDDDDAGDNVDHKSDPSHPRPDLLQPAEVSAPANDAQAPIDGSKDGNSLDDPFRAALSQFFDEGRCHTGVDLLRQFYTDGEIRASLTALDIDPVPVTQANCIVIFV